MSALGQEQSFRPHQPNVRFAPEADVPSDGIVPVLTILPLVLARSN
jgi:hypothetical protein